MEPPGLPGRFSAAGSPKFSNAGGAAGASGDSAEESDVPHKPPFRAAASDILQGMTGLDLALDAMEAVDRRPQCILIAGPNGAGKSTTAMALAGDRHRVRRIMNPDVIAGGLSGTPELSAVEACRIALRTQERYIAERLDFALETTLSGRRWDKVFNRLDNAHYLTTLYYLWLDTPDLAVARVRTRVMKGGHGVAEDEVRRRYGAGLVNLLDVVSPRVDAWHITNATTRLGAPLSYIAHGGRGLTSFIADHAVWEGLQRTAASYRREHSSTAPRPERP